MNSTKINKTVAGTLLAAGALSFSTGCEVAEIQAIVAGVELVADTLLDIQDSNNRDDEISFGDWLVDELRD